MGADLATICGAIWPGISDKTDSDNRGVNDPRAAAMSIIAIDDGGRSRPEYLPIPMSRISSGRQKAPPLLTVFHSSRRAQSVTEQSLSRVELDRSVVCSRSHHVGMRGTWTRGRGVARASSTFSAPCGFRIVEFTKGER